MAHPAERREGHPQGEQPGCNTLCQYWSILQSHTEKFVMDYPLVALVTAVVFLALGISQFLPSFLAAVVIGIPLTAVAATIGHTIYSNYEQFLQRFEHEMQPQVNVSMGSFSATNYRG